MLCDLVKNNGRASLATAAIRLALCVALVPNIAWAGQPAPEAEPTDGVEGDDPEVDALVGQAQDAYEANDYEAAVEAFQGAYAISDDPAMLFNIGRVYEEAGKLESAVEFYERFVIQPKVSLEHRALAQERLEVLRPLVQEPEKAADTSETVPEESSEGTSPSSRPKRPAGTGAIITGAALTGVGGVALILGATFAVLGQRDLDDADSATTPQSRDALQDRGVRNARIGDGGLISGALLVAAGVPVLVVGLVRRQRSRQISFAPTFTHPGAVLVGRF